MQRILENPSLTLKLAEKTRQSTRQFFPLERTVRERIRVRKEMLPARGIPC